MLRSASSAVRAASQSGLRTGALASSHARFVSSTTPWLRNDDSPRRPKENTSKPPTGPTIDEGVASTSTSSARSQASGAASRPLPGSGASAAAATTKPVHISYSPPNKGTTGGGSITLNLPPQLVQAMSRKNNVAPTKTSSARAKAQASKALRQTLPQPTTGQVYAWATAHSYSFSELVRSGRLPSNHQIFEDNEVIHIPQWPVASSSPASSSDSAASALGRGEVFIFRSGSYVTWGLDEEQSQRFLRNVIQGRDLKYHVEVGRYPQIGDEAMDYLYARSQLTRVQGDMIVIGQPPKSHEADADASSSDMDSIDALPDEASEDSVGGASIPLAAGGSGVEYTSFGTEWTPTLARLAFSQGLARSARLSVQESALSRFLSSVSTIPAQLESAGSVPLSRSSTIKHTGTLLRLRQTANLDRDNFYDEPEVYWENSKMEDHYRSICHSLELGPRFETLNDKLDHCENLLAVVRALLTEKTTHRMELIIIGLIAFEAGLALLGHGWVPTPDNLRTWWNAAKEYFANSPSATQETQTQHVEEVLHAPVRLV